MTHIDKDARASKILRVMDEIDNTPLSVNHYFKEKKPPFGRAQYSLYKKRYGKRAKKDYTTKEAKEIT